MHICFDWDGTLARKEVAEEAAMRRLYTLGVSLDRDWMREAQKTHAHYKANKDAIGQYTGITDERMQTIIMTNLFQFHYLGVVNEWKEKVFYQGVPEMLKALKKQKHHLSIASTIRQDIIEPALEIVGMNKLFDAVKGNTPDLAYPKEHLVKSAMQECGEAHYMVGDRDDDMAAGREAGAKTIFVTWGATELQEKKLADYVVEKPQEIIRITDQERRHQL